LTDTSPPVISAVSPAAGATGVKTDASVVVSIADAGLGVDFASIGLYVDDAAVIYEIEGSPGAVVIRYTPAGGFAHGTSVGIRVEACDLAGPANCAAPLIYTFSLEANLYVGLPEGAIVPDGFWAGDPRRPLEVRNLPGRWTVRIFDTGGATVRRYTNESSDGTDWTWDFANGAGRPVARALYLVRVTDERGALRQSGRFLVQFDP
ncbi:MAG: Ig-like domain-containing protein, partial [Candidatus Krumholzibacteria bacterium]|nr:Ig-like domain-containing protein [Candidatus Krumholzibacteria bacterium]